MLKTITLSAILLATAIPAAGQGLFSSGGGTGSLIQDRRAQRAARVGDILTVLVLETTSATNTAQTETQKAATNEWTNAANGLGFLPGFSLAADATNDYQGQGTTSRQQQITARVSVTVVDVRPNGDLVIEGSRVIEINGEREVIYLTGSVNPFIIPASNTIESFRVADLQVSYKGKGVITEGSRPGFFVRVLNWIF